MARKSGQGRRKKKAGRRPSSKPREPTDSTTPPATAHPAAPNAQYDHSPQHPPALRFDPDGDVDRLHVLLDEATRRPLTAAEAQLRSTVQAR